MERIKALWSDATPVLRALFVTALSVLTGGLVYMLVGAESVDMAPLYTRLDPADAQELVEELESRNIPYEVAQGGAAVLVPRAQVAEARMQMASAGLPKGGGVGFELFDKSNLMMTDFAQKVNYRRALQGELSRTIGQMPEVESARVHLAIPDESIFSRNRTEPTASVFLKLRPGRVLGPKQAYGVVHLVSSSVENLPPERVAVLDGAGRLLGPEPDNGGLSGTSRALNVAHDFERHTERRIVDLLEPIVGMGKVVARVNADLDLSRVEETQEEYDPDNSTLRSERTLEETTSQERNARGGVAGTAGNLPVRADGSPIGGNGSSSNAERTTTESDYAIPRTVRKVQRPMGSVQRLSIAVVLDAPQGEPEAEAEAEGEAVDSEVPVTTTPLPSPEALASIIKKGVGFDPERGDQLELMFSPFTRPPETEPAAVSTADAIASSLPPWAPPLILLVLAAGVIGFVVYSTEKRRQQRLEQAAAAARAARERAAASDEEAAKERRPMHLKDQVRQLAANNVNGTVDVLKGWLAPTQENHGN